MANTDPFTTASSAILSALSNCPAFTALVAARNLIDVSSDTFEQFRTQLSASDVPEAVLLPAAFVLQPFGVNSRVASMSQTFELICTFDSLQTGLPNALKFAVLTALLQAGSDLGQTGLIRSWEARQGKDDFQQHPQWRRGSKRWVSLMEIIVHMDVARTSLAAGE